MTSRRQALRDTANQLQKFIREELLPELHMNLCYDLLPPEGAGQYWVVNLCVAENETLLDVPCGYLHPTGHLKNEELDIAQFFRTNDALLDEFDHAERARLLDKIVAILDTGIASLGSSSTDSFRSLWITIDAHSKGDDPWTRSICTEMVLILHIDEKDHSKIYLGSMQSERYRIRVPSGQGFMVLRVPFDKVGHFKEYERLDDIGDVPFFEYEVALSFAGEDRNYVEKVAAHLKKMNIRLFYDKYETVHLWGKDLYTHLHEVYNKKARFCVLFLSEHYRRKLWTSHERQSAQARAFEEAREYLLPVRLDTTEIPGIRPTMGYVDRLPPKALATLIREKIFSTS